ncbi:MAG: hypothetical protein IJU45_00930 [Clostridia bacterium]|nr:hypothetical protein [Clostridia bacterium]
MLDISIRLSEELNKSNIRYLLWKGNNHFKDGLCGKGDVDMLVHRDDRQKVHSVLKTMLFLNPETQAFSRHDDIEDFIGFDSQTGTLIHLHLHFNIVFGKKNVDEYSFVPTEKCFDLCVKSDGFNLQDPAVEYLILLCRVYTGALTNAEKISENTSYLKSRISRESFTQASQKCGLSQKEAETVFDFIESNQSDISCLSDILNSLIKKNSAHASLKYYKRKIQYILYKKLFKNSVKIFTKKSLKNGGRLIAFVGQDGAGKSTAAKDVLRWLRWKLEARKFYLGSGEHYFSVQKKLTKLIPNKGIFRIPVALLVVSDNKNNARRVYKTIKKAKRYSTNGGIAVFDRFPQTVYAGINDSAKIRANYLNKTNNKAARAYMLRAAKKEEKYIEKAVETAPDLLIKLMLSVEESLRRKPDEKAEGIARKHEIIKELSFGAKEIHTVDVTQNYDDELIEIKNIIWNNIIK